MFQAGLQDQYEERDIEMLPVEGSIPAWLSGSLIRNGPAQWQVGEHSYRHWFDGLAMLHRFGFDKGSVSYRNRFLQSADYRANNAAGKITFRGFATDPCRNIFQRVMSVFKPGSSAENGNVNITKLGNQMLALTETPLPVAFDPDTLATVGVVPFDDGIDFVSSTAHPHFDPEQDAGIQHLIKYGRENVYQFATIANTQPLRREVISRIKVSEPGYVHSFGMTARYLILAECPFVVNPVRMLFSNKPFIDNFVWKPEQGTRFFIVDKSTGDHIRTVHADACFIFHHVNAFEDGDDIILDVSAYEDSQIISDLFLDELRRVGGGTLSKAECRRYRLPASGERASYTVKSPHAFELPRINYRYNAKPYRFAYGSSIRSERQNDFINALVKIDLEAESSVQWWEADCYPGEPVFVAGPESSAEDDGVILSVVLDGKQGHSFLLALDAQSFTELGRATVPSVVPFGFHGQYFS